MPKMSKSPGQMTLEKVRSARTCDLNGLKAPGKKTEVPASVHAHLRVLISQALEGKHATAALYRGRRAAYVGPLRTSQALLLLPRERGRNLLHHPCSMGKVGSRRKQEAKRPE